MAKTYIKLGPIGDAFASKELGLYLDKTNASEIDELILNNRLVNFLLSGFIVIISQLEYDNIKLLNQTTSNIPLNSIPIGQPNILEPVEDVLNSPEDSTIGKRYLVPGSVPGIWLARKDQIAQSDGLDWIYTKPENGMILPVYAWGISLHYTGTYPSGSWDIPVDKQEAIDNPTGVELDYKQFVLELLKKEADARALQDATLLNEINRVIGLIPGSSSAIKASNVTIKDDGNYYDATNVEAALQAIGLAMSDTHITLTQVVQMLESVFNEGFKFKFLTGEGAPTEDLGDFNYVYVDTLNKIFYQKTGTIDVNAWQFVLSVAPLGPKRLTFDIGTPIPIILDFTEDVYKIYGNAAKILIEERITDTTSKDRADIYVEKAWDNEDHDNLVSITIAPQGGDTTTEKLDIIITQ